MSIQGATNEVYKAWTDKGPRPDIHDQQKLILKINWPTLYKALVRLEEEINYKRKNVE